MNESDKLHLSDWFNAVVAVGIFLFGILVAGLREWLKGRRSLMQKRMEKLEAWMSETTKQLAVHEELLAVAQSNMRNIEKNLDDLKDGTREQTKLLHDILLKVRS